MISPFGNDPHTHDLTFTTTGIQNTTPRTGSPSLTQSHICSHLHIPPSRIHIFVELHVGSRWSVGTPWHISIYPTLDNNLHIWGRRQGIPPSRRIQHACLTNIHSSIITQTLIQKHSYFLDYIIVICPGLWIGCVTRHTHCDVIWWVNEMCYMSHWVTVMWHVWWIRCATLILGHCHVT